MEGGLAVRSDRHDSQPKGMERPAEVIELLRLERGLTQAEACVRGQLPPATWSRVESGATTHPDSATKLRVARALGVSPSRIWPVRPRPLHIEDVEDPRWSGAVQRMGRRLEREGSVHERTRFADRLIAVLDQADSGAHCARGDDRWQELWQLAASLVLEPKSAPIEIVGGRLVERDLGALTVPSRRSCVDGRPRRRNRRGAS
jgi:transcriptional regulator with XRE-family HTH domain